LSVFFARGVKKKLLSLADYGAGAGGIVPEWVYNSLRKRIGKKRALRVANTIEKTILIFGREVMPYREI